MSKLDYSDPSRGKFVQSKQNVLIDEDRSIYKPLDYRFDIKLSNIYLEGDIEMGSLFDFMIKVGMILEHRNQPITTPINLIINSDGGDVYEGLGIIDFIDTLPCPVNTNVIGRACSMAAIILAAGTGTRVASKNAIIMVHELSTGNYGKATDLVSTSAHIEQLDTVLFTLLNKYTKRDLNSEYWQKLARKDYYMNSESALRHGLIDKIL
jgi:ATP-dependent Clp protease protease subunit